LDIDAALVDYLSTVVPGEEAWARLTDPQNVSDRRMSRQLWDNVRTAKEMLSRSTTTLVHLPLLDDEVPLGREQLDQVAAPILDRTIVTCREALDTGSIEPGELAAVFLVGGASRMPAIATALHRALGVPVSIVDQPELAVATGSLLAAGQTEPVTVEPVSAQHDGAWPPFAPAVGAPPQRRRRILTVAAAILAVLIAVLGAVYVARPSTGSHPARDGAVAPSPPSAALSPSTGSSPSAPPGIDPCLVGRWRLVTTQVYGILFNVRVQYTNGGGVIKEFRSDGTASTDYNNSEPIVADFRGARWSVIFRGTEDANYFAKDGVIQWSGVRATGTAVLYRNGKADTRGPLEPSIEAENYVCQADSYRAASSLGNYVAEYARVPGPS
jgi:molecular chaperone DnaK